MKKYEEQFNALYKGKQYIDIEIVDENPLSKTFTRYNQGGKVCSCREGNSIAKQKIKNGWQDIECDQFNCAYRQKNEQGKTACNRIGWLKFLVPQISKDRIFLMKITGQQSIKNLDSYFSFQKSQGLSVKGQYVIFLSQEEQSNNNGQTFNNYIINIIPKKDFILAEPNSQNVSTVNTQNVNNNVANTKSAPQNTVTTTNIENTNSKQIETKQSNVTNENITDEGKNVETKTSKEVTKKGTRGKTRKIAETKETKSIENKTDNVNQVDKNNSSEVSEDVDDITKYFVLESTFNEMIADKSGLEKPYLIGRFHDSNENIIDIAIKPEDAKELQKCDIGTIVKLDVHDALNKKFAIKLEYISKMLKKVAA